MITKKLQLAIEFIIDFVILILFSGAVFIVMSYIDHKVYQNELAIMLIVFSMSKAYYLIAKTLKKMETLTKNSHTFKHLMLLSIIVISLIITSFTLDYLCVSEIYLSAFTGFNPNQPFMYRFFDLMYFSIVTFTTVGYGDIFPIAKAAKMLTILEMGIAFITIVFIISKYIRNNESNEKS